MTVSRWSGPLIATQLSGMPSKKTVSTLERPQVQPEVATSENASPDFAPRQMSPRQSAAFSVKLFAIVVATLGLLWLLDRFVAP